MEAIAIAVATTAAPDEKVAGTNQPTFATQVAIKALRPFIGAMLSQLAICVWVYTCVYSSVMKNLRPYAGMVGVLVVTMQR